MSLLFVLFLTRSLSYFVPFSAALFSLLPPQHVILADTINLLKAMQTKLQIEEAEICTLKQQAAAVGAIAAQHQVGSLTMEWHTPSTVLAAH
jgi:hypothetical protein